MIADRPLAAGPLPTVRAGWRCVVADPAWSFRDTGSRLAPDQDRKRARGAGYSTMRLEDIIGLPVPQVVARDAFLFLWTTDAHLVDGSAARVAKAWGFTPKRTWVWVKRSGDGRLAFGGGHYVRTAHELVLVCRRGSARFERHDIRSVFFAPRARGGTGEVHSTKPAEFMSLVESVCHGPRLELFSRAARPGWTAWGLEAPRGEGRAA